MKRVWLIYALLTMALWGLWGALSGLTAMSGFPETLVYCIWALVMIIPTMIVLGKSGWKIDTDSKSILHGLTIGLLGAGGQMLLFYVLTIGPAYLIFPVISVSPLVTITLAIVLLNERTSWLGVLGIILAMIALPLFDLQLGNSTNGSLGSWLPLSIVIMACWGLQAFFMKLANVNTSAESIFFYMTVSGILLIPVALFMTDFSADISWSIGSVSTIAAVQILNAVGALLLVFAFRSGKAIVVSPLVNAGAPLVTAVISLAIAQTLPPTLKMTGILLATIAAVLLAIAPENKSQNTEIK